ncbi:BEN domain-containing protein 5 isoform X1 [Rhinolophus ferrumequinum]|uniref:BEN domain-containing protein 5 n=3 Tax=Rhinolophoidea TaxID=3136022 RepID=A0A671DRR3_RHIFE|nr:BEN domain-containing protein 5 isoform X1 [Rhinolophus ferrumequinum]
MPLLLTIIIITVVVVVVIQSFCPFPFLLETRSGCDCSGLTLRVAVRFQTPLVRPRSPFPLPLFSAPRPEQPIGRAVLSGTITVGGPRGPGSRPAPRPGEARARAGSPPPCPPRGLSGPTGARPRRPPCTPLCGSWRTTSATRCPCRACATSVPARGWILTTRRCTPCTGAQRSWAPGPTALRAPPATGERCCSTRPRSWRWQRPEGRKPGDVAHKSIEAVVARLEKQNGLSLGHGTCPEEVFVEASPGTEDMDSLEEAVVPRALYEELLRNYQQQQEEMRHLQQELERTRRQLVQQAKKLKEYGALVSEMKELRDLNRRLQDVLLLRLGSGPAIDLEKVKSECLEPEPELRSTFSEEANTSSYYPAPAPVMDKYILDNGKVHLGSGIWVDEEKWHQLQVTQGDSKYTKNLAVMIWGTDVLKNRSVTGVATKKKKDAVPKPPLSPHKLSIVRECLYDRIAQETVDETEIAQRLSKVNKYICEKIMDINKSCKNEERREAKYNLQ